MKDKWCWIIFLLVLALSLFTGISPILLVVMAGVYGYLLKPVADKEGSAR